jgi:hypothetical protein
MWEAGFGGLGGTEAQVIQCHHVFRFPAGCHMQVT